MVSGCLIILNTDNLIPPNKGVGILRRGNNSLKLSVYLRIWYDALTHQEFFADNGDLFSSFRF